ncbi:hypothetical protein FB570_110286 [Streptomyces sp. T12]|nr:hypothetical protein FB570_110286 [Streptomyces sp. T12]
MHRPFADRPRTSGRRPDPTARRTAARFPGAVPPSARSSAPSPARPSVPSSPRPSAFRSADVERAATGPRRTR